MLRTKLIESINKNIINMSDDELMLIYRHSLKPKSFHEVDIEQLMEDIIFAKYCSVDDVKLFIKYCKPCPITAIPHLKTLHLSGNKPLYVLFRNIVHDIDSEFSLDIRRALKHPK